MNKNILMLGPSVEGYVNQSSILNTVLANPFGNNYACQNTRNNVVLTKIHQVLQKSY